MLFGVNTNARMARKFATLFAALAVAGIAADEPSPKPANRPEATAIVAKGVAIS